MRLTTVILIASLMQVSAASFGQRITLKKTNASLFSVLKDIRKQSGFDFYYEEKTTLRDQKVSLSIANATLEEALSVALKGLDLVYEIDGKIVSIKNKETSSFLDRLTERLAAIDVRGRVVDDKNSPLVGATVSIKGTDRKTITNENGDFSFTGVDEKAILVISFIGYQTQEIPAAKANASTIKMEATVSDLKEVTVNTGYGIEKRTKELGYSVAKVTGEEITRANSGNILTGLIGKVSGVNITTQSTDMTPQMRILIRGIRSFGQNSNNQPLFIFNGSPLSFGADQSAAQLAMNFLNNIDPNDIEDVTILKGANGTAIYGPEGVNGVIILTTKKGVKGQPVINFRTNNSFQIVDFRRESRQRLFGTGSELDVFGNKSPYSWGPRYDGSLVPIGYADEKGEFQMVPYEDTKEAHKFFNIAIANRNNLSFSNSDATSSFYLGLGYLRQTGLLPGDKQNQANILLNVNKTFGLLNIQLNMNYARSNDDRGPDLQGEITSLPSFIPVTKYKDYVNDHWSQANNYWNGISPYQKLADNRTKGNTSGFTANIAVSIKPFPWLTIRDQPGINYTGYYSKSTGAPIDYAPYAAQDPNKAFDSFARVSEKMTSSTALNNDLLISTVHKMGNFVLRTNSGNTIRQNFSKDLSAAASLVIPVYNLAYTIYTPQLREDAVLSRTTSFFGNTLLGYKDRVFLELTGRNEWDSKQAVASRGKTFYYGANTSVVLPDVIPVLKDLKWLTTARLRASYARSANMNISPYQSERRLVLSGGYPIVNNGDYLLNYTLISENPNPRLQPEKVISQEYGGNFSFLNNRIIFDLAYYYQRNNSVILAVQNAWLSGYPSTDNAGDFENYGWEFDLKLMPLVSFSNKMNISVQAKFAINDNKVLYLTPVYKGLFPVRDPSGQGYYAREGHSAFEFNVRDFKRDPQGRVIVDRTNGMPTAQGYNEVNLQGRLLPKYVSSLSLNFNWKKFSMNIQADYTAGYDHLFDQYTSFFTGTHPLTTLNNREPYVFPNSVYKDDSGNYVENKDIVVSNAGQELYQSFGQANIHGLTSGAFLKIREFAVQYDWTFRSGLIKGMSTSLYGRDLFSFYPKSNINGDPGFIKGPGQRTIDAPANNLSGGSSEVSALPGTVLMGFTLTAKF